MQAYVRSITFKIDGKPVQTIHNTTGLSDGRFRMNAKTVYLQMEQRSEWGVKITAHESRGYRLPVSNV